MKKKLHLSLSIDQNNDRKVVEVQPWVSTAMDAKRAPEPPNSASSRKLQVNMTFCKAIINHR